MSSSQLAMTQSTFSGNTTENIKMPFLTGRPHRERIISLEDVVNLLIALNTSETLEEFLQKV